MLSQTEKSRLVYGALALMVLATLYFAVKTVAEVKGLRFIGGGPAAASTITFSGQAEINASPDIALINVTVREEAKTVQEAQNKASTREKAALDFLAKEGIANKDIKTEIYNTYPKYDYGGPCYGGYCPSRTPKIVGYEVTERIAVKVRDLDKAGTVVGGLGAIGISEIEGPNFAIENEDQLRAEARAEAIEEAKAKALRLADDLGVRLVRIVNFSEDSMYPRPMYKTLDMAMEGAAVGSAAPSLPTGENTITSNVTITYEIR